MKFLRALGDGNFKKTEDGLRVFFPYGPLARGWIVDSEDTYNRLVSLQSVSIGLWLVLTPLLQTLGWVAFIGCLLPWGIFVHLKTQRLIKNLEHTDEKFTFQDVKTHWAESFALGPFTLWFLFVVGFFLFFVGGLLFIYAPQIWLINIGLIGFGCSFMFLSFRELRKNESSPL